MTSMKLVSVNIEHSKHLDRVIPFLGGEMPDVVCLQEVVENDLEQFTDALGMHVHFVPQCLFNETGSGASVVTGEAVLSRCGFVSTFSLHYGGTDPGVYEFDRADKAASNERLQKALPVVEIEMEGERFWVATTHGAWSPDGEATDVQLRELPLLLAVLESFPAIILTGDFNAPRGGAIFTRLAERYTDNIPPHYLTSIDLELHRAGTTDPIGLSTKMVDGLFTTPEYRASDVRLVNGVSDHCAIVATISTVT